MSDTNKTPALKIAQDKLRSYEYKLLEVFARVFNRKRPPSSLRSLQAFAMVLMLEAFGLAFLLDRETVRAAILAARGPGKGDDDDLLDDSDEMVAIRWASARQEALDRAYMAVAKEQHKNDSTSHSFAEWIKRGYGPDRATFERQWGERNPIDPATAPKCFDPSAQLSILDAVGQGDGYLGVFVSTSFLTSSAPKQISCMGQTLDLEACETLDAAAWRAVSKDWIAYLDHRGAVVGLRLIPRTDGIQTRLRAPLVNIVSMFKEDKRDERIAQLEAQVFEWRKETECTSPIDAGELMRRHTANDRVWQDATGASDPEMARELTVQRINQIETLSNNISAPRYATKDASTVDVVPAYDTDRMVVEGVGRMVWPDHTNAPCAMKCANAIVSHRRGEFVELNFPATPKIFDNVRAWLGFHQFGVRAPTLDATGYCTCAIGPGGEIPPAWNTMKQGKRDSYPGFVLFAPDGSAKVVFCAKEPSIGKVGKRRAKVGAL
jgi:hypothetical protein